MRCTGMRIGRELTGGTRLQDTAGRAGSEGRGLPVLQGLMPDPTVHHAAAHPSSCFHHTPPDAHTHMHTGGYAPMLCLVSQGEANLTLILLTVRCNDTQVQLD